MNELTTENYRLKSELDTNKAPAQLLNNWLGTELQLLIRWKISAGMYGGWI